MYLKLLEEKLKELLGEAKEEDVEVKLNINAYISEKVVKEDRLRLELYKRLSMVKSIKDVFEIEKEMVDRFGKLDTPTKNFLEKIRIKILAKEKGIKSISNYGQNISIVYKDDKKELIKAPAKDDEVILESIKNALKNSK
jgi:transcription-repair coupling factor (superfamily II helicase)